MNHASDAEWHDVLIVGAGPIGLACGLEAVKRGLSHVIIDKGCLCNSLYHYPIGMTFFSTPELLEIGGVPFVCRDHKPTRAEGLQYYRRVADVFELNQRLFEQVEAVEGVDGDFEVRTSKGRYRAGKVIVAIGFFDQVRPLGCPGEELPKVTHYYKEPFYYANLDLLIVGSGNSAVIAALECYRHGVRVGMAVRGADFHEGIKYWLRPDIDNRIADGQIKVHFNTRVVEVLPDAVRLQHRDDPPFAVANDFVLALTGYQPDFGFLTRLGVELGPLPLRIPSHDAATFETNRRGLYLAGVIIGGMETNRWFIENCRLHATAILEHIASGRTARA